MYEGWIQGVDGVWVAAGLVTRVEVDDAGCVILRDISGCGTKVSALNAGAAILMVKAVIADEVRGHTRTRCVWLLEQLGLSTDEIDVVMLGLPTADDQATRLAGMTLKAAITRTMARFGVELGVGAFTKVQVQRGADPMDTIISPQTAEAYRALVDAFKVPVKWPSMNEPANWMPLADLVLERAGTLIGQPYENKAKGDPGWHLTETARSWGYQDSLHLVGALLIKANEAAMAAWAAPCSDDVVTWEPPVGVDGSSCGAI